MESALYLGTVRHRRHEVAPHRFTYPLFMLYADLDEIDDIGRTSALLSVRRPAFAWLRRRDYFGAGTDGAGTAERRGGESSWADTVRRLVEARTGRLPAGPVRLLTHPRTLGFRMNPVSFYYCHDASGELAAIVGEVTNTPWDERHLYVVEPRSRTGATWEARFPKELHVSPFLSMDHEYRWLIRPPGDRLLVHMENYRAGRKVFDATLNLQRRPLTRQSLRRTLLRYPAMTLRVFLWIYLQAARLKLRGIPFHPHPTTATATPGPPDGEPGGAPRGSTAPPAPSSSPASRG